MGRIIKILLTALFASFVCSESNAQEASLAGAWIGTLETGTGELRVVFNIETDGEGYSATMDSPDQGAFGIPTLSPRWDGRELVISIPAVLGSYSGQMGTENRIVGEFSQGGVKLQLVLTREEVGPGRRRVEPVPPYPYESENVVFRNEKEGIDLAGTFTCPSGSGPFPGVVLLAGSGPNDRDEYVPSLNHKPFLVLSDYLTRNGFAVLRFDKRGVGESGGDATLSTLYDLASDAAAAMEYLSLRPETDAARLGYIGHSEGGSVLLIASRERKPAFAVSLAGSAVKGDVLMKAQRKAIITASGFPAEHLVSNEELVEIMNEVTAGLTYAQAQASVDSLAECVTARSLLAGGLPANALKANIVLAVSPGYKSFLEFDPHDIIRDADYPLLFVFGGKDLQVPAELNGMAIESIGNPTVSTTVFYDMNHLFQIAGSGLPREYGIIEHSMHTTVLDGIAAWIRSVLTTGYDSPQ